MLGEPLVFAGRDLLKDWTVMDRLGEITAPTLVMAGRDDFVFPPECQRELADGIAHARSFDIRVRGRLAVDRSSRQLRQELTGYCQ